MIVISLPKTAVFYEFAKEQSKLYLDYEFETQIEYFAELCSRDTVTSDEIFALLEVAVFWEMWLNDFSSLKKYTDMVVELGRFATLLNCFNETAKIKEE